MPRLHLGVLINKIESVDSEYYGVFPFFGILPKDKPLSSFEPGCTVKADLKNNLERAWIDFRIGRLIKPQ